MTGKPKKPGDSKPGWGGRRPGAGRKRTRSPSQIDHSKLRARANKMAKRTGKHMDQILLDIACCGLPGVEADYLGAQPTIKERIAAARAHLELLHAKRTESETTITEHRVPIELPARQPDPAKLVPIDGGKKEGSDV